MILVEQGPALVGEHGILPATRFLDRLAQGLHSRSAGFWELPSLFWLSASDACCRLRLAGLLGALAMLAGFSNAPLLALLWALYLSFTHVGQIFYGYGWTCCCRDRIFGDFPRARLACTRARREITAIGGGGESLFRWLTFASCSARV